MRLLALGLGERDDADGVALDLDAADSTDGTTPLLSACQMSLGAVALALVARGADSSVRSTVDGHTALYWAQQRGLDDVVAALTRSALAVEE